MSCLGEWIGWRAEYAECEECARQCAASSLFKCGRQVKVVQPLFQAGKHLPSSAIYIYTHVSLQSFVLQYIKHIQTERLIPGHFFHPASHDPLWTWTSWELSAVWSRHQSHHVKKFVLSKDINRAQLTDSNCHGSVVGTEVMTQAKEIQPMAERALCEAGNTCLNMCFPTFDGVSRFCVVDTDGGRPVWSKATGWWPFFAGGRGATIYCSTVRPIFIADGFRSRKRKSAICFSSTACCLNMSACRTWMETVF